MKANRVISFTGGKGGTGKSTVLLNVARCLTALGRSVLVFDADLGLANIDILLGVRPQRTVSDVVAGRTAMEEVILATEGGIDILPAGSGVENLLNLSNQARYFLLSEIERVAARYDYLLIDTPAGIGVDVLQFASAAHDVVCVMTPEPTSLTDSYALMKVLAHRYGERQVHVIVNQVGIPGDLRPTSVEQHARAVSVEAERTFVRFSRAVERFLHVGVNFLGGVPDDEAVRESIRHQRVVVELFPSSGAAKAFREIAATIDQSFLANRVKGGMQLFFRQVLGEVQ